MPLIAAIDTSLVAVSAFGAATAASFAASGFMDFAHAALFVVGGIAGGLGAILLAKALASRKRTLNLVFATLVIVVGST